MYRWMWRHTPVIPELGGQTQEDRGTLSDFKASLNYMVNPSQKDFKKNSSTASGEKF